MGVSEKEKGGGQKILEKITLENFSNLRKTIGLYT